MLQRMAFALVIAVLAGPATAADDAFSFYYDRYAVMSSNEPVPQGSDTSSFYRSQFAVLGREQARSKATARVAPEGELGRADCACSCHHKS